MKTQHTFFCLMFDFCLSPITAKAQINVNDSLTLVDFYNSADGRITASDSCRKICLTDTYRYEWNLCATKNGSVSTATGTVNFPDGTIWKAWGWLDLNTGNFELHAVNPKSDKCASGYADSFIYRGITSMRYNMGNIHVGGARGTSYCGGSVVFQARVAVANCGLSLPGGLSEHIITPSQPGNVEPVTLKVTPNPVQNYATISYQLSKVSKVNIVVYNYLMQPVKILYNGTRGPGNQSVVWDTKNVNGSPEGSGLYIIAAIIDGRSYSITLQVVK